MSRVLTARLTIAYVMLLPLAIPQTVHGQAAHEGIRELLRRVEAGYHAADPDLVVAAMTDDVILLPSGAVTVEGRSAVRARYETYFRRGGIVLSMDPREIRFGDTWAVVRGSMSGRRVVPTDEGGTIVGKFIMIVDRQPNGSWLLSRLIWNDDPEDP